MNALYAIYTLGTLHKIQLLFAGEYSGGYLNCVPMRISRNARSVVSLINSEACSMA